jgi:predicted esterase
LLVRIDVDLSEAQKIRGFEAMEMSLVRRSEIGFAALLCVFLHLASAEAGTAKPSQIQVFKTSPSEFFGGDVPQYFDRLIDAEKEITWDAVVPKTYSPDRPPGLIIFISYTSNGLPPERWHRELEQKNLIWVAARESGNTQTNGTRKAYALLGKLLAERDFEIDPSRIYLSGMSGGGRLASLVMAEVPKLFDGAIYFSGVNFLEEAPELYEALRGTRFVFVTGTRDYNLTDTRKVYRRYRDVGLDHSLLIVVPEMEHVLPPTRTFRSAITFLDKREP